MHISEIISFLESVAHPSLQEPYDNAGLLTGNPSWSCSGILCSLDVTEEVVAEAAGKGCNLVVAHHPAIFTGLKKITGSNYTERTIILAIKKDIAIYAIHTNLDNIRHGVNGKIAEIIGLKNIQVLAPKGGNTLKKLFTFAPADHADRVRAALFAAGTGHIGQYDECSFNTPGTGTFRAGAGANPYVGETGKQHQEHEIRIETIFPAWLESKVIAALKKSHPYEEVAYDIVPLANPHPETGAGLVGELELPLPEEDFLALLESRFEAKGIRHTRTVGRPISRVAVCGGAGSFLIFSALRSNADAYVTADVKYHEFFNADGKMLLADIGHFESEQWTISLLQDILLQKFPTFAVLKTAVNTNPVFYFRR
ncbi:MAG TPA: Nif3-like dinuclear metal center hexameric protein [Chitinophagaceae bacterium]|nr:Nif3-like dinuclear metal center hexameric protein [Chitinophagaceae bacterium]